MELKVIDSDCGKNVELKWNLLSDAEIPHYGIHLNHPFLV